MRKKNITKVQNRTAALRERVKNLLTEWMNRGIDKWNLSINRPGNNCN